jgi:hypothetical protein
LSHGLGQRKTASEELSMHRIFNRLMGFFLGLAVAASAALAQAGPQVPEPVQKIFHRSCGVLGCHQGQYPKMALNLETAAGMAAAVNAPSMGKPEFKLTDPADPDKSYILMKLKGDRAIAGRRMPSRRDALKIEEVQAIRDWIGGLKDQMQDSDQAAAAPVPSARPRFLVPAFWGTRLVNLPTVQSIDKGLFLFRISHRFLETIGSGTRTFFGLDSPSQILIGFGYGISDRLGVSLSRANIDQDVEVGLSWLALSQNGTGELPFSASLHVSANLTTLARDGRSLFDAANAGFNFAVSLAHQFSNRISLLLVPAYASNTSHGDPSVRGTLSLGIGGRFMVLDDLSLIGEWTPVLSGLKAERNGWGFGIEKKIGGHVFQLFFLNSKGLTTDQVLPGGDLRSDVRLGFNIFRSF